MQRVELKIKKLNHIFLFIKMPKVKRLNPIHSPRVALESKLLSQPPGLQIPLTQIPKPVLPHFVPSITLDFLFSLGFVLFGRQYRMQRLSGLSIEKTKFSTNNC